MSDSAFRMAIVDDEPNITKVLKQIIKVSFDCEIETFNDPQEALARFKEQPFDVLSFDHRMPKLTGMQLVKELRTTEGPNQFTRIIVLTGFRDEAESYDLDLLNEVVFLDKPVSAERYTRWVKFLLKNKEEKSA